MTDNIASKIISFISKTGYVNAKEWYVGIATDPKARLFNDHKVKNNLCGYIDAGSTVMARAVEKKLLKTYPFKGGPGGGDNPRYVYTYRITPDTLE